jgi:hypothetical protein
VAEALAAVLVDQVVVAQVHHLETEMFQTLEIFQ